jgi:hypothetical protein
MLGSYVEVYLLRGGEEEKKSREEEGWAFADRSGFPFKALTKRYLLASRAMRFLHAFYYSLFVSAELMKHLRTETKPSLPLPSTSSRELLCAERLFMKL